MRAHTQTHLCVACFSLVVAHAPGLQCRAHEERVVVEKSPPRDIKNSLPTAATTKHNRMSSIGIQQTAAPVIPEGFGPTAVAGFGSVRGTAVVVSAITHHGLVSKP